MEERGEAGAAATGAAAEQLRGQEDGDPEAGREESMHRRRGHDRCAEGRQLPRSPAEAGLIPGPRTQITKHKAKAALNRVGAGCCWAAEVASPRPL